MNNFSVMKARLDLWTKKDKNVSFPAHIQAKLNGMRCLAYWNDDQVVLLSRGNKFYTLPHIQTELEKVMPKNMIFDGELYCHRESRQTIQSWVTRQQENTKRINFCIFDCVNLDKPNEDWSFRYNELIQTLSTSNFLSAHCLRFVSAFTVRNDKDILTYKRKFEAEGYEGAVIRNLGGVYSFGKRSSNVIRVKSFQEAEYKIVGYKYGRGRNAKLVTWKCIVDEKNNHETFFCESLGTHEERLKISQNPDECVGRMLTVRYAELSDDGVPLMPKGVAIRIQEDMDADI